MTLREVVFAIEGLRERDKLYRDWIRRATYIIGISGMNAKFISSRFDTKLWPIEAINIPNIRDRAKETLKRFKETEQKNEDINKVKELIDGRRTEDSSRG
jgi:hypothetical protein